MRLDKEFKNQNLEHKRQTELRLLEVDREAKAKMRAHRAARRGKVATLLAAVDNPKHREIAEPLLTAAGRGKLLQEYGRFREPLVRLARRHDQWLRDPLDWTPDTHNPDRQFASLLRHLLAKYPVPAWMDAGFLENDGRTATWFMHVGSGQNLRTARTLPFALTKKQAHHAMAAPAGVTPVGALRRAIALDLGCTPRVAEAWIGSRVGRQFFAAEAEEFWLSVVRWFARVAGPMFDSCRVGPALDYLHHLRFEPAAQELRHGRWVPSPPLQPNLSMHGRTVPTLLAQVERWHGGLSRARQRLHWNRSSIPEACWVEGRGSSLTRLSVRELLSTEALMAEGRKMAHCVASYDRSCHGGRSAIFSMCSQTSETEAPKRHLTVEVDRGRGEVVQIRGRFNAFATPAEARWLRAWLSGTKLALSRWAEHELSRGG